MSKRIMVGALLVAVISFGVGYAFSGFSGQTASVGKGARDITVPTFIGRVMAIRYHYKSGNESASTSVTFDYPTVETFTFGGWIEGIEPGQNYAVYYTWKQIRVFTSEDGPVYDWVPDRIEKWDDEE